MADAICRWRNGTPKTVVELVNSMPHKKMLSSDFREFMSNYYDGDFFHTPYQLACQLALYYESEDGYYYPRFDHDITEEEAEQYLLSWFPKYYIPNPYTGKDGFKNINCPTYFLKSLYDYTKLHPNCQYKEAYKNVFKEDAKNNNDIISNYINNFSQVLTFSKVGFLNITDFNPNKIFNNMDRDNRKEFFDNFNIHRVPINKEISEYKNYITALKTKPFLLLAGISGTGKSRLVQELAYMSCPRDGKLDADDTAPGNYCLIEVKPNWHDSTELLGYYSAITERYELTPFIRFVYKAIMNPDVPFFVCLDEMNLAPVEQYFAEYLSVLETRKRMDGGEIQSAELLKKEIFSNCETSKKKRNNDIINKDDAITYKSDALYNLEDQAVILYLKGNGMRLPQNLFVIGTVNMDDTTHQFSRKVIDRAFTIEMNGSDLMKMFDEKDNLDYRSDPIGIENFRSEFVAADQVLDYYPKYKDDIIKQTTDKLNIINNILEDTPFCVSYRVLNELILYISSLLAEEGEDTGVDIDNIINEATLAVLLEKILPRVEGDDKMMQCGDDGKSVIINKLIAFLDSCGKPENTDINTMDESQKKDYNKTLYSLNKKKLEEMNERLKKSYFTSFFS